MGLLRACSGGMRSAMGGIRSVAHRTMATDSTHQVNVSAVTEVPTHADVVVIGGGSLGCNTLYHLAKLGITNTVLLETHKLTAGTTWHTAGLLWRLRPSDSEIQLINTTRELLIRLEDETGVNPGWVNNGGLFIASSKERVSEYERLMTIGRVHGVESHILTPTETKQLYPLMNIDDITATLYCPGDGTMDPAGLCEGLTRSAVRAGAKLIEGCPVTDIKTRDTLLGGRKVTEVHTPKGVIKTNAVVNATGCWANDIAEMVDVCVPLTPMKHAYVVTEKIPGIQNMPNVRDHDTSVYLRLQGDALAVGGYEVNPIFLNRLDREFAFGLYDLDWDVFSAHINGAINRVPQLEKTGIKSTVCGPESFTPDHKPVMGEDPTVEGFYHCCGFNSSGMMLGGGCGDQMAKWIAYGRPELDMFAYDIRRFHTPLNSNRSWVDARSHESYAKNYSIVFPHDEPLAGRGIRKSPIHEELEAQGCVYQERHGWERPGWFAPKPTPVTEYDWYGAYLDQTNTDKRYKNILNEEYTFDFPSHHDQLRRECIACRESAAIFDMSYFGKYILSGPDAQKAADWIFSANMRRNAGTTVYTCMLNDRGGAEADLTVSICDDSLDQNSSYTGPSFYIAAGGAAALQNLAHIQREIRYNGMDCQISDKTDDMAMLSIQGQNSRSILQQLTNEDLSNEGFPFSSHRIIDIAGHKLRALRLSFVGELGWELHIPNESALPVYRAIKAIGQTYGLVDAGYRAIDSLSCEKGYRHWHADLRPDDTPLEAGLGFACKLKTDIDFLGRKALEEHKAKGLRKKLVTITLQDGTTPLWGLEAVKKDGEYVGYIRRADYGFALGTAIGSLPDIWGLEAVKRDGEYVGYIRRADYGFALGTAIGYGYVKRPDGGVVNKDFLSSGKWEVEIEGVTQPANIHITHPFDPKNLRVKGIYKKPTHNTVIQQEAEAVL